MTEQERAELVAYLDGELDDEATHRVETKVNVDPTVRAELETLRRTWELLDHLPKAEPSPSFTHATMCRLPARARETQIQPKPSFTGKAKIVGWVAAMLLFMAGGYFAVSWQMGKPTEEDLIRELRVIENLRPYRSVKDLEFLKALDRPELFGSKDRDF